MDEFFKVKKRENRILSNKSNRRVKGRSGLRRRLFVLCALVFVAVLSFFLLGDPYATSQEAVASKEPAREPGVVERVVNSVDKKPYIVAEDEPAPEVAQESQKPSFTTVELSIKKNDTLYNLLRDLKVPPEDIINVAKSSRKVYDLRKLRSGDLLKVSLDSSEDLDSIEFRYADFESMIIERDPDASHGFTAAKYEVPHYSEEALVQGEITNSLYESALRAGTDPKVIMDLTDIFAWDVDFATDIRKGDTFKILFETVFVEGIPLRTGPILAAEVENRGKKYTAIYYKNSKGRGDYYDANGKTLTRTLLKSPLRFSRISSHFSKKRYHPILKRYKPHHGIDYAAPTGTPVETSGDGKVVYAGWKGGYGKYVKIKHNSTYSTVYAHLSRIGKGIRKGARVKQGQVIGKVGKTGRVTGPHLHYEVVVRGKVVNPLSVKSKARKSLKGDEKTRFSQLKNNVMAKLEGNDPSIIVAMADN